MTQGGYVVNENGIVIPMDEDSPLYPDYATYVLGGNSVDFTDYITSEEIEDSKIKIRKEYSYRISNIEGFQEALERKILDGTEIPQNILDERESLRIEYRDRIG
jgi:hypothetical protein